MPVEQLVDEVADAGQELARGKLGEGDRRDRLGRSTAGEQQRQPAGHNRGLTRASAGLDEDGAVVCGHRLPDVPLRREGSELRCSSDRLPDERCVAQGLAGGLQFSGAIAVAGIGRQRKAQIVIVAAIVGTDQGATGEQARPRCAQMSSQLHQHDAGFFEVTSLGVTRIEQRCVDFDVVAEQRPSLHRRRDSVEAPSRPEG